MSDYGSFNDLLPGKFYGKDDVLNGPITLTIAGFEKGALKGKDGGKDEPASFITFEGTDRRLVVKPWTIENLRECGFANQAEAIGKQVEAYHDPKVSFGGKKVGGLRLRKAESGKAPF